jgi:hypothetical protein
MKITSLFNLTQVRDAKEAVELRKEKVRVEENEG